MSLERVFKVLVSLGLSEPDARIYMYLALRGPKKPNDVVNNLKINQQQILQSLKNLQNKDIIFTDKKNKKLFSALSFEKTLKLLIKTQNEQTTILQENLLSNWKDMMQNNSKT